MENEEEEDLLLEVTESEEEVCDKEEIDYYIKQKILDFIQNEKQSFEPSKKTIFFIVTCFFLFLSSSVLLVTLPIYIKNSTVTSISNYSKFVSISFIIVIFFVIVHVIRYLSKFKSDTLLNNNLCFTDVIKVSFLLSLGNLSVFWLVNEDYVSCHLKDPLKGCSIVFSLVFYFLFSRKKMSLERTFCAITIIIGVFVSVDFGICDKFHCYGNSNLTESSSKLHFLYVVLYLLAHGIWVLNFTFIEVCYTSGKASNSNDSVFSKLSGNGNSCIDNVKPSIQSLSIICQDEEQEVVKKELSSKSRSRNTLINSRCQNNDVRSNEMDISLNISVPHMNQLSVPDFKKFPLTSTPNNELNKWRSLKSGRSYNVALWQHIICFLIGFFLCWMPTISFLNNEKSRFLKDVINEVFYSFCCHLGLRDNASCNYLSIISILVSVSYVVLILSSIEILKTAQSAVTVVSVMMAALPMASFFWSLFRITDNSISFLEFNPEITGESICALLGFPIIGIGIVLLLKSHIREFKLVV